MTIAVTGSDGFLGRHLRARLLAAGRSDIVCLPRDRFGDPNALTSVLQMADAVVHLAGVNRGEAEVVEEGNVAAARRLVAALEKAEACPRVLFADSVQRGADNPYGRGKERASALIAEWASRAGAVYADLVLPNLFGESGRPDYNSFVATFCHRLARGEEPEVDADRELELLHAQDAAALIIEKLGATSPGGEIRPGGTPSSVSGVLSGLRTLAATYDTGTIPDLSDPFMLRLFNTYRSYLYPERFPVPLARHGDARGVFVEAARSLGGGSQSSFSTTVPGVTRGNHFHLRKVERFVVLKGRARIAIRPVWGSEVYRFDVSGEEPAFVDMPTLCTHSITNHGDGELYTAFWANEVYDPADPDTFPEAV